MQQLIARPLPGAAFQLNGGTAYVVTAGEGCGYAARATTTPTWLVGRAQPRARPRACLRLLHARGRRARDDVRGAADYAVRRRRRTGRLAAGTTERLFPRCRRSIRPQAVSASSSAPGSGTPFTRSTVTVMPVRGVDRQRARLADAVEQDRVCAGRIAGGDQRRGRDRVEDEQRKRVGERERIRCAAGRLENERERRAERDALQVLAEARSPCRKASPNPGSFRSRRRLSSCHRAFHRS